MSKSRRQRIILVLSAVFWLLLFSNTGHVNAIRVVERPHENAMNFVSSHDLDQSGRLSSAGLEVTPAMQAHQEASIPDLDSNEIPSIEEFEKSKGVLSQPVMQPSFVVRGGTRGPDMPKQIGGFVPNAKGSQPPESYTSLCRLDDFCNLENEGKMTAWVSTSRYFGIAAIFAKEGGYVYRIHTAPNMVDVATSLGPVYEMPQEAEFSALGRILWSQVEGWVRIPSGYSIPDDKAVDITNRDFEMLRKAGHYIKNNDYDPKWEAYRSSGAQPQLAGLDPENSAWDDEPFNSLERTDEKSADEHALEFMNKNAAPFDWTGQFSLIRNPEDVMEQQLAQEAVKKQAEEDAKAKAEEDARKMAEEKAKEKAHAAQHKAIQEAEKVKGTAAHHLQNIQASSHNEWLRGVSVAAGAVVASIPAAALAVSAVKGSGAASVGGINIMASQTATAIAAEEVQAMLLEAIEAAPDPPAEVPWDGSGTQPTSKRALLHSDAGEELERKRKVKRGKTKQGLRKHDRQKWRWTTRALQPLVQRAVRAALQESRMKVLADIEF